MCSAPFLRFSQQSSKPLPTLIIRCRFQFLQLLLKKLDLILPAKLFEKREVVLDIVFPKQILCKMPSAPAMMQRCIPRELFCTALSIPWCLSEMTQTSLPGPTTCIRTRRKNHSQLFLFSFSTKANARGTNALSASQEMATKSVPMYLPNKKVPSIENTGRQCLNDSTD